MKKTLIALIAVLLVSGFCAPSHSATGNFNLLLGGKSLDKDDWESFSEQSAVSFHLDVTPEGWPVALAFDLLGSGKTKYENTDYEFTGSTGELDIGVRKFFGDEGDFAGFVGGGIGSIGATWEDTEGSTQDSSLGLWVDAGVQGRFFGALNLGIDLRYSTAPDVTLYALDDDGIVRGHDVSPGGFTTGIYIGYGW